MITLDGIYAILDESFSLLPFPLPSPPPSLHLSQCNFHLSLTPRRSLFISFFSLSSLLPLVNSLLILFQVHVSYILSLPLTLFSLHSPPPFLLFLSRLNSSHSQSIQNKISPHSYSSLSPFTRPFHFLIHPFHPSILPYLIPYSPHIDQSQEWPDSSYLPSPFSSVLQLLRRSVYNEREGTDSSPPEGKKKESDRALFRRNRNCNGLMTMDSRSRSFDPLRLINALLRVRHDRLR